MSSSKQCRYLTKLTEVERKARKRAEALYSRVELGFVQRPSSRMGSVQHWHGPASRWLGRTRGATLGLRLTRN